MLRSSIGKKNLISLSGLALLMFIAAHLAGNLTVYAGAAWLDSYAEHLHSFGVLVNLAEAGLVAILSIHVIFAVWVTWENWRARPVGYVLQKPSAERTWASRTMPYTGVFILIFIVLHLINFRFVIEEAHQTAGVVNKILSHPAWAIYYSISMLVLALHVSHGLWSSFQTLGLGMNSERFFSSVRKAGLVFSLVIGAGFGLMPMAVWLLGRLR